MTAALLLGTIADTPAKWPKPNGSGMEVVAADFHVHPFPFSWATLAPWDLVLEAKQQQLDAIAIAGHNHIWVGKAGRWFARLIGGPIVVSSEEVHPPSGHVIALGIERTVDWDQSSEAIIDHIHRQGGVAIAAHPTKSSWIRWPDAAIRKLDGSEVEQPVTILRPDAAREMAEFHQRAGGVPVRSSDYHGLGPLGLCRTYLLVRDKSEAAILEALRAGRVVDMPCDPPPVPSALPRASSMFGILALLLIVLRPGSRKR
jgi:hypothetical protein